MNEVVSVESPLESVARRVADVPMLPVVVSRLLEMVGRENHSAKDMVHIVEHDSALTLRVLRVANSAAYSRGQQISSLQRAILQMGEKMVISIAIESCSPWIFNQPLEGYESPAGELWDHSLQTAIITRELTRFSNFPILQDLAFTAGLLHDVGKVIISEFLEGNTAELAQKCDNRQVYDFLGAERGAAGTDHCEIGFALAQRWNLPQALAFAIRDHHHPVGTEAPYQSLVFAVHLGDLVSMMGGAGTGVDSLAYKMDPGYGRYLTLQRNDLERLFSYAQEEFAISKAAIFSQGEAK